MMYSWGRGEDGQLGLGDTNDQYRPVPVDVLKDRGVVQICCGSGHTVVLSEEGEVYTWGRGDDGRLGHGDNGWKYVPRTVEALRGLNIVQVTCGSYHTAAITDRGDLYSWGGGMYGKLGHGNESGHSKPCLVEALKGVFLIQIACGSRHTIALADTHDVYTWGDQENGVAGHGETEGHQYLPRMVAALRDKETIQVAACGFHTAALTASGRIYTWGEGKFGRLGHGDERNRSVPTVIASLAAADVNIAQVACGGFHSAAFSESGQLYTWGGGEHGQLGHGDKKNETKPKLVKALGDEVMVMITCGWSHTAALTDTGTVYTWGNGDHGKLGYGDTNKVTQPRVVEALEGLNVVKIASYNEHTAALTDPSAVACSASPTTSFMSDMHRLINNPDHSDITFLVEGRAVYAHKAILAIRCDHFRAMFASGMKESRESEVTLPDISYPTFVNLMQFIYTDTVDVAPDEAIELYVAADLYTMSRLKTLCEAIVRKGITVDNAALLLLTADSLPHGCTMLDLCLRFIVRHFDVVSKTEGFARLSRELILDILRSR